MCSFALPNQTVNNSQQTIVNATVNATADWSILAIILGLEIECF